jgi:choline-glycine betaine transporter
MLVIKTKDELTIQQIKDNIDKSIRAIDKVIYSQQNSYFIVAMLLPLTTKSSSEQILNKLINNGNLNIDKFKYMSFSMDESSNSYSFIQEV